MPQDPINYWEQFERLERLIKASELKAGLIFSFHSLVLGLFFDRMNTFRELFENSIAFSILVGIWLSLTLVSLFFSVKCFIPRIERSYDKNVFFFGDIVHRFGDVKAFSKAFMEVCEDEQKLYEQLSEQIHVESKIIDYKFRFVQYSMNFLAVSLVCIVPLIVVGLVQVQT